MNQDFQDILSAFCDEGVEFLRIDVMTSIDGVEFEVAWSARIETEVAGITLPVISRSHLAQSKRGAGRPQDVADLARLEGKKR